MVLVHRRLLKYTSSPEKESADDGKVRWCAKSTQNNMLGAKRDRSCSFLHLYIRNFLHVTIYPSIHPLSITSNKTLIWLNVSCDIERNVPASLTLITNHKHNQLQIHIGINKTRLAGLNCVEASNLQDVISRWSAFYQAPPEVHWSPLMTVSTEISSVWQR